jgi:hypothetical protein
MRGCIDMDGLKRYLGSVEWEKHGYVMGGTSYGMKIHLSKAVCSGESA